MSGMTLKHLKALRDRHRPAPPVFVETGTYHGKTTRFALELFAQVHTIELGQDFYEKAVQELKPLGVNCYWGNSGFLVPILAGQIGRPVFWYLDAHWFATKPGIAGRDHPLPLWAELEAISQRPYQDVIAVDDASLFGGDRPTPEWREISLERIASYFPGHREAVVLKDQALVYR